MTTTDADADARPRNPGASVRAAALARSHLLREEETAMDERGIAEGMTVYDADGARMGEVVSLDVDGFLVEQGLVFPRETFVRYEDVAGVSGHEVRLARSDERLAMVTRYSGAHLP